MTIKQQGGVFGRNPTFNDVEIEGTLTASGSISVPSDSISGDAINGGTPTTDGLTVDTTTLVVDAANNRLGFGTATPDTKVEISDTFGTSTSAVKIVNASAAAVSNQGMIDFELGNSFSGLHVDVRAGARKINAGNHDSSFIIQTSTGGGDARDVVEVTKDGNIVLSLSGAGIDFSATSGTGTSELFDDYEEGTWTPAITFGGGNTGVTYSAQSGNYTKIGNLVTITCYLVLTSKGTSTGNVKITGLPFSNVNFPSGVSLGRIDNISFTGRIGGNMTSNATTIDINETTDAGVISGVDDTNFSNSSSLYFSTSYHTS
jgi:hypothetical protein